MTTIGEAAKSYEPKKMKNITDLEVVTADITFNEEDRISNEGDKYHVKFIIIDGEEYRTANTVLEQLKAVLKEKPDLKAFKVTKAGVGLGTKYTVIPL